MIHDPDSLSFCNRTYQHWELNRWRELFYDSIPSVAISTGRNLSLKSSSISFLSNVQSMSDMYTTSWKCITLFLDSRNDGLRLEDHSFWRWFWFDRRQGERLWSVTTDQAPFFFKLRRAKIGFDAFQRKALYWIQGLSWKHWFLFQSQSPTTILTIWLRLLARWCDTGPRIMIIFWISKNCHYWWACVAQSMINPQSENLTAQIDLQMQTTRQKVHGCG